MKQTSKTGKRIEEGMQIDIRTDTRLAIINLSDQLSVCLSVCYTLVSTMLYLDLVTPYAIESLETSRLLPGFMKMRTKTPRENTIFFYFIWLARSSD